MASNFLWKKDSARQQQQPNFHFPFPFFLFHVFVFIFLSSCIFLLPYPSTGNPIKSFLSVPLYHQHLSLSSSLIEHHHYLHHHYYFFFIINCIHWKVFSWLVCSKKTKDEMSLYCIYADRC